MVGYYYNGASVQYCQTLEFKMEQELDPSGVDALWNKYTIRVRGFVSASQNQFGTQSTTAIELNTLKNQLETPRRPMSYSVGATTLVSQTDVPDAKLGPFPLPATVYQATSGVFMVEAGCVVRQYTCDANTVQPGGIVSLRWGQTETFDENWNSQIITQGKLIVRSDLRQNADIYRNRTLPIGGPLPNYRRLSSKYVLSPDGLTLDFEYVDAEQDRMPPFPATRVQGTFTVSVDKGTLRKGNCELTLEGPRGISRGTLLCRAMNMAFSKFLQEGVAKWKDKAGNPVPPVYSWSMVEDLVVPQVRLSMTCRLPDMGSTLSETGDVTVFGPGERASGVTGFPSAGIPATGLVATAPGLAPPVRKAIQVLLTSAFRDPCLDSGLSDVTNLPPNSGVGIASTVGNENYIPPPASIVVSPVVPWFTKPTVKDNAPYDTREFFTTTTFEAGDILMPATGVGNNPNVAQAVSVSGGRTILTVAWVVGRTGLPPVLPAYFTNDPNLVPLGGSIVANQVTPNATGATAKYETAGYYKYGVVDPSLYQITAPVAPPYQTDLINNAARYANAYWNDQVLNTRNANGTNPFVVNGVSLNTTPLVPDGLGDDYPNELVISQGAPPQSIQDQSQNTLLDPGSGGGDFNVPTVGP